MPFGFAFVLVGAYADVQTGRIVLDLPLCLAFAPATGYADVRAGRIELNLPFSLAFVVISCLYIFALPRLLRRTACSRSQERRSRSLGRLDIHLISNARGAPDVIHVHLEARQQG